MEMENMLYQKDLKQVLRIFQLFQDSLSHYTLLYDIPTTQDTALSERKEITNSERALFCNRIFQDSYNSH